MSETSVANAPKAPQTFSYEAVSKTGQRVKAKMVATSQQAVYEALADGGWFPIKIVAIKDGGLHTDVNDIFSNRPIKFDHRELADFSSQLHQLLKAGVPVYKALQSLGEEAEPKRMEMCYDLADMVSSGIPLSQALESYPKVFDLIFRAYIAAGEAAGTLVETTGRLALMLDRRSKMALKIKSVTAYPKLVSIAILLIVTGIMMFLVPMYADIYSSFGAKLPAPTQALVNISNQMLPVSARVHFSFPILTEVHFHPFSPLIWGPLIFVGVRLWLKKTKDDPEVGIFLDKLRYRMPIFGALNKRNSLFRWASTLSGGIESGVSMTQALELSARTSGSRWQLAILEDLQGAVRAGKPLSEGLAMHKELFPPNLRAMVATGESTGDLPVMLDSVASALDSEIDALIAGLSAKIEVALLLVMGIVVGGLLAVLYLPILNLATTVGSGLSDGAF